jgi:hypothetical protein
MTARKARLALPVLGLTLVAALVATSFYVGRMASGGGGVSAQDPRGTPTPVPPGQELPAMPDTSQPGWASPYQAIEDAKSRYNQTIAGITVGPDVDSTLCPGPVTSERVAADAVRGTVVDFDPSYLPEGARLDGEIFATCGDVPSLATREYFIPPNEDDVRRLAAGEITFFEARHGGSFGIHRRITAGPEFLLELPAERMRAGEVAGRPAVLVEPMFPEGYGFSAVVIWDKPTNVMTVVQAHNLTLDETVRITQGVFQP